MGEGESQDKDTTDDEEWVPRDNGDESKDDAEAEDKDAEAEDKDAESGGQDSGSGDGEEDISDITAPSVGPNTTIEKEPPEERLAKHEQSDKDAMGLDKRRQIIGGSYGPTKTRQIVTWLVVVVVIGGAAFGLSKLASNLDEPPKQVEDQAPWTGSHQKPSPLQ